VAKQNCLVPPELLVQQNEKPRTQLNPQQVSCTLDFSVKQQKKLTSSCVKERLSRIILARVVHISSAVNIPEAAILPNA